MNNYIEVKVISQSGFSNPNEVHWGVQVGPMFIPFGYSKEDAETALTNFESLKGWAYWPLKPQPEEKEEESSK